MKASRLTMRKREPPGHARPEPGRPARPMWLAAKITGPELGTCAAPCTVTRQVQPQADARTSGLTSRRPHSFGAGNRSVCGRSGLTPGDHAYLPAAQTGTNAQIVSITSSRLRVVESTT